VPFAPLLREGPWLFDLERDPDESYDVRAREPGAFERLARIAAEHRAELAANPRGWR
jgi:hypothetical protein